MTSWTVDCWTVDMDVDVGCGEGVEEAGYVETVAISMRVVTEAGDSEKVDET
jgi:hypothetical protein